MIGKKLAHYEIVAQLGKGGMGEVFRARDTKLDRDVALKVLPTELSGDPERKARFEREARSLASLQHTNVASIYGFEDVDGVRFLVMELVEGEDLATRLERGPVTPSEARSIALQLASGLEAAHDAGLVHRDLKPANVMLSPVGDVKILDFGLARAWFGDADGQSDPALSPTITAAMTQAGTILGTAAYMSPEQARGRSVDRRADIWAYGVILYEMMAGRPLFAADTVSDTLAAVLRAELDWAPLPVREAPELCLLVERCLERDPKRRLRDIGEARLLLEGDGAARTSLNLAAAAGPDAARRSWLAPLLAVLALAAGIAVGATFLGGSAEPAPVIHAMIPPPPGNEFDLEGGRPAPAVLSPDGTMIVFGATNDEGETLLWLRHVNREEAVSLSGTEGGAYPFWSPDSKSIGFLDGMAGRLRKVAVSGGPPVTLCPAENLKGGTWNERGQILFAPTASSPLHLVSESGGESQPVTELQPGEDSHRHPRFLPDGEHYLFLARTQGPGNNEHPIFLGRLGSTERREVARSLAAAEYTDGQIFTVRDNVLMAMPFPAPFEGTPSGGVPVVEDVAVLARGSAVGVYSFSRTGMLVYQTGAASTERQITALDLRGGNARIVAEATGIYRPRVSPDGTTAVVEVVGQGEEGTDLWMVDLETGIRNRFTFAQGDETRPVWSPDGKTVVYKSLSDSVSRIVSHPVEGTGRPTVIYESKETIAPTGFRPDGGAILLERIGTAGSEASALVLLHLQSGEEPSVLLTTERFCGGGRYSPDGRWVAYHEASTQGADTFVTPADGSGRKWQVSRTGEVWPQWNSDGTRLLTVNFNGQVREYVVDGTTGTFRVGESRDLVRVSAPDADGRPYELHPDQSQILRSNDAAGLESSLSLLHLVSDWKRGLLR